jgi:hypothetical protein
MLRYESLEIAMNLITFDPEEQHRIAAAGVLARAAARISNNTTRYTLVNILITHFCFDRSEAVAHACLDAAYKADSVFSEAQITRARAVLASAGPEGLYKFLGYAGVQTPSYRTLYPPDSPSIQAHGRLLWSPRLVLSVSNQASESHTTEPTKPADSSLLEGKRCAICGSLAAEDSIQCEKCGSGRFEFQKTTPELRFQQELQRQRQTTEACLSILRGCDTRSQIIESFGKISNLLSRSGDPLAAAAEKVYRECSSLPDDYVRRLRNDFIRECEAFLSASATVTQRSEIPDQTPEPGQKPHKPKEISTLDDVSPGEYCHRDARELCRQLAASPFVRSDRDRTMLQRLGCEESNLYITVDDRGQDWDRNMRPVVVHFFLESRARGEDFQLVLMRQ